MRKQSKREWDQLPYRDSPTTIRALRAQAHLRQRTASEQLRLAVAIHLREALLWQQDDPDGRAEAEAEGHDVDAEREVLIEQLAELRQQAFTIPEDDLRGLLTAEAADARLH